MKVIAFNGGPREKNGIRQRCLKKLLKELHHRARKPYVKAPYLLTQKLLPALKKAKGNVINISSYFAQKMLPGRPSSVYSLTKGAINSLTKALAYELGPEGVRVNAIAPGTVNTPLVRNTTDRLSEEQKIKSRESIKTIYPLGRIGEPEDLGGIAVYLASDEARWVTGSIFNIDGGLTTT